MKEVKNKIINHIAKIIIALFLTYVIFSLGVSLVGYPESAKEWIFEGITLSMVFLAMYRIASIVYDGFINTSKQKEESPEEMGFYIDREISAWEKNNPYFQQTKKNLDKLINETLEDKITVKEHNKIVDFIIEVYLDTAETTIHNIYEDEEGNRYVKIQKKFLGSIRRERKILEEEFYEMKKKAGSIVMPKATYDTFNVTLLNLPESSFSYIMTNGCTYNDGWEKLSDQERFREESIKHWTTELNKLKIESEK